jgi:hypothetical protein
MGMINGGLGLQLSGASNAYVIPYSVAAGICALGYTAYSVNRSMVKEEKQG